MAGFASKLPRRSAFCLFAGLALALGAGFAGAAETPRYGGTLVMGMGGEPRSLNPTLTADTYVHIPGATFYNQLVELDNDFNPRPDLAASWTVTDGGKTYTFKLASGVRWHDGKPFSSADVKYTYEEVLQKLHTRGVVVLKAVERVEAPDPQTVVFRLKYPYEPFLIFAGGGDGKILPRHLYGGTDPRKNPHNLKPVGTGPFRLADWKRGSHITVVRNPDYFKKGEPYLDRIIFKFIPNSSSRIIALESGEIDYITYYDLPSSEVARLKKVPQLVVTPRGHHQNTAIMQLHFNHDRPVFKDRRVRQAIAHAIDKEFILQKADYGLGQLATGPIASQFAWAYNPNVRRYPFDPKRAEQLLEEAGYKRGADGVRFRVDLIANRGNDIFTKTAEILDQQLKRVGVEVKVRILDRATMLNAVFTKREFDMWVHGLATGPDPDIGVARLYASANIRPAPFTNAGAYRNSEVDRLFAQAGRAPTREERARLYRKAQEILVEDAAYVWLLEYSRYSAFKSEFRNLHTWSPIAYYQIDTAWWAKGRPKP